MPATAAPEPFSATAVIETALADVQSTRTTWSRPDLLRAVAAALPDQLGGLDPRKVRQLLEGLTSDALRHAEVQQVGGEIESPVPGELRLAGGASAYEGPAGRTYALRSHIAGERAMARAALDLGAAALDETRAADALAALTSEGLILGPDQHQALAGILTSGARVETLVGPAGTGKSTVVGALARVWTDPRCWPVGDAGHGLVGIAASQIATDVLAGEGVTARNVTRWLATQHRLAEGRPQEGDAGWQLGAGDIVVVDEAAMLPTADLLAVHRHVSAAGAKLLLTGDHRQLAAVGAGGGMALLAAAGGSELTEVRRFTEEWEGAASLRLRDGDEAVLHDYRRRGRLVDGGTREQARASAARAWLADTLAGRRSVLVVDTNEDAAQLSAEVRAELVRLGRVAEDGVPLGRDGTTAGVGDLVQARRNGWELAGVAGNTRAPINRETYRVTEVLDDGGLVVLTDAGEPLTLPPAYVFSDLTLGYAGTVHSTQGRTVDTAHVVAGAGTSRQALYVGLTRGRDGNHAHLVTRPTDESQPAGIAHEVPRADPLGVAAAVIRDDESTVDGDAAATVQLDEADRWRESARTAGELFAAEAELVYSARTAATLDRLTADGQLATEHRLALARDTAAAGALARLLRSAELAGHDPDHVLSYAVAERSLHDARSPGQVLYRRIVDRYAGRLAPTATTYADMVPAVASTAWQDQLVRRAAEADTRRRRLGEQLAADPPRWALESLREVPSDPATRLDWENRAGVVAAWREVAGHTDEAEPLGPPAPAAKPEHHALWRAAWTALGRPDPARADAELSDGQLRVRIRGMAREENWAPAYVGESLTAATLAADTRRGDAEILAARADAAADVGDRERLHRAAAQAAEVAATLRDRVDQLARADDARARWLAHTAVTRDAADRARAELAARGAPIGAEAGDAVTPAEWLASHRADTLDADQHRVVSGEHDLTEAALQRTADLARAVPASGAVETAVPDARDAMPSRVPDERGRVPTAEDAEAAIQRAQEALREIAQRQEADHRRTDEEDRTRQLARWVDSDAHADEYAEALSE